MSALFEQLMERHVTSHDFFSFFKEINKTFSRIHHSRMKKCMSIFFKILKISQNLLCLYKKFKKKLKNIVFLRFDLQLFFQEFLMKILHSLSGSSIFLEYSFFLLFVLRTKWVCSFICLLYINKGFFNCG